MGCRVTCASKNNEKDCISIIYNANSSKLPISVLEGLEKVLSNQPQASDISDVNQNQVDIFDLASNNERSFNDIDINSLQSKEPDSISKNLSQKILTSHLKASASPCNLALKKSTSQALYK